MTRDKIIEALMKNAEGNIAKAKANVEIFLTNPVGVATHGDTLKTIIDEIKVIQDNEEVISVLNKHFPFKTMN